MNKLFFAILLSFTVTSAWADNSIQGTYKSVLVHESQGFHQFATMTLRTVNLGDGNLKISANVRVLFGDWNTNEFLSYEYPDVSLNILTRQISLKTDENDVSFIGYLKDGKIVGEWYASAVGRVGSFAADKQNVPNVPEESTLAKSVTGHYRGLLTNTNPDSNLPERMTLSLVTSQNTDRTGLVISGNVRFYLGGFDSPEFVETKLSQVQFNFYSRFLTLRTENYGITLKGTIDLSGNYKADVFADGLGHVGTAELRIVQ